MNGNKAILLVRVSTEKQNFDEQEQQLYQMALADGFAESAIIAVCEKESGIKLREDERRGLNRMKEIISEGGVSCVYCWEVSRIGRKKKVIFSITEYLQSRGIQLIVKEPYLKLLNPDGSINDAAETVLTLYAQIAESEMRNKMSRWQRTRIANSRNGIWNGGKNVRYGYSVEPKTNRYIINESEAEIIRLVYTMYTGEKSAGQFTIKNDLEKRGIFLTQDRIQRILKFEGYCGRTVRSPYWVKDEYGKSRKKTGHELKYPAIISEEMYDKAQAKKENANANAYKGKHYYFAKGLIKCPLCGHAYIGYKNVGVYQCVAHRHDNKDIIKCGNSTSININILDTLLFDAASSEYVIIRSADRGEVQRTIKAKISEYETIMSGAEIRKLKVAEKKKRTALIYADGMIGEDEYATRIAKLNDEISAIDADNLNASEKIEGLKKVLSEQESKSFIDLLKEMSDEAFSVTDLREMFNIVHTYIDRVEIAKSEIQGKKATYIKITAISGKVYEYKSRYCPGGKHPGHKLYRRHPGVITAFSEYVEISPAVRIKRPLGVHLPADAKLRILKSDAPYYKDGFGYPSTLK